MGAIARWSISKFGYDFGGNLTRPFLIIFIQQLAGGSLIDAGMILALIMGLQSVLSALFGWLSDKIGRRGLMLAGGFIDSYVYYLLSTITSFQQLYLIVVITSLGGAMRSGALAPFEMGMSEGKMLGTKLSAIMLVSDLAVVSAAVIGGLLLDWYGFRQIFFFAAIVMFVFNIGILFVKPEGEGK